MRWKTYMPWWYWCAPHLSGEIFWQARLRKQVFRPSCLWGLWNTCVTYTMHWHRDRRSGPWSPRWGLGGWKLFACHWICGKGDRTGRPLGWEVLRRCALWGELYDLSIPRWGHQERFKQWATSVDGWIDGNIQRSRFGWPVSRLEMVVRSWGHWSSCRGWMGY